MENFTIITETKKLYPKAMQTLVKYHNLSFVDRCFGRNNEINEYS
jgi:hypothetical protein